MIKYYCDFCGKEIGSKPESVRIPVPIKRFVPDLCMPIDDMEIKEKVLCFKCLKRLKDCIALNWNPDALTDKGIIATYKGKEI